MSQGDLNLVKVKLNNEAINITLNVWYAANGHNVTALYHICPIIRLSILFYGYSRDDVKIRETCSFKKKKKPRIWKSKVSNLTCDANTIPCTNAQKCTNIMRSSGCVVCGWKKHNPLSIMHVISRTSIPRKPINVCAPPDLLNTLAVAWVHTTSTSWDRKVSVVYWSRVLVVLSYPCGGKTGSVSCPELWRGLDVWESCIIASGIFGSLAQRAAAIIHCGRI